jgi:chromosome segregation protein
MPEDDIRWMTYAEIRDALGLTSTKAALQRSRRAKWPRRLNNSDNLARVGVPTSALQASRRYPSNIPSQEASRTLPKTLEERDQKAAGGITGGILPGGFDAALLARLELAEARLAEILELTQQVVGQFDVAQQAARAAGEAAALKEAVRLAEDTAHRAQEAARLADKGWRDADARAAALQVERDAAQHRAVEAVTVMGQLAHRLEDYQRQVTEAARQATEAEQRATAADAARHEIQNRLAQLEEEAKNASMQGIDLAELETAQARATEAEQRAIEAKRLADEADRRATIATERLDRFQRERIAQAQAAAENTRAFSQEVVPLWRRVFGRRRRP